MAAVDVLSQLYGLSEGGLDLDACVMQDVDAPEHSVTQRPSLLLEGALQGRQFFASGAKIRLHVFDGYVHSRDHLLSAARSTGRP